MWGVDPRVQRSLRVLVKIFKNLLRNMVHELDRFCVHNGDTRVPSLLVIDLAFQRRSCYIQSCHRQLLPFIVLKCGMLQLSFFFFFTFPTFPVFPLPRRRNLFGQSAQSKFVYISQKNKVNPPTSNETYVADDCDLFLFRFYTTSQLLSVLGTGRD